MIADPLVPILIIVFTIWHVVKLLLGRSSVYREEYDSSSNIINTWSFTTDGADWIEIEDF